MVPLAAGTPVLPQLSGGDAAVCSDALGPGQPAEPWDLGQWDVVRPAWEVEGGARGVLSGISADSNAPPDEAWIYDKASAFHRPDASSPSTTARCIALDITFVNSPPDPAGKHGGLMLGTTRESRWTGVGYEVDWVDHDPGGLRLTNTYRIIMWNHGVAEVHYFPQLHGIAAAASYHWDVYATHDSISLWVDGDKVGSVNDNRLEGDLWLGLWAAADGQHLHVDDLVLNQGCLLVSVQVNVGALVPSRAGLLPGVAY